MVSSAASGAAGTGVACASAGSTWPGSRTSVSAAGLERAAEPSSGLKLGNPMSNMTRAKRMIIALELARAAGQFPMTAHRRRIAPPRVPILVLMTYSDKNICPMKPGPLLQTASNGRRWGRAEVGAGISGRHQARGGSPAAILAEAASCVNSRALMFHGPRAGPPALQPLDAPWPRGVALAAPSCDGRDLCPGRQGEGYGSQSQPQQRPQVFHAAAADGEVGARASFTLRRYVPLK